MSVAQPHLLACEELTVARGGRELATHLNLSVEAGDALLLSGPNGSGKSTLLMVLATLLEPLRGTVKWQGRAVNETSREYRGELRYLGHANSLKEDLSMRENLAWLRSLQSASRSAEEVSSDIGLSGKMDVRVSQLSAGQQRRVGLAALALKEAPLWLLDEPFAGLDRHGEQWLLGALARHRRQGGAVVLSTHDAQLSGKLDQPRHLALG